MPAKKVPFGTHPQRQQPAEPTNIEEWAERKISETEGASSVQKVDEDKEPTNKLTININKKLHQRLKGKVGHSGTTLTQIIVSYLEQWDREN